MQLGGETTAAATPGRLWKGKNIHHLRGLLQQTRRTDGHYLTTNHEERDDEVSLWTVERERRRDIVVINLIFIVSLQLFGFFFL